MRDIGENYEFYYTQDGSIGLYSYTDEDVYHSKFGAITEAWEKFIIPSGIDSKLNTKPNIKILDVCYGIGYNTKALMSYVINSDEKILYEKKFFQKLKNFLKKIKFKIKFVLKNFQKKILSKLNIVSIDNNNPDDSPAELSSSIETIYNSELSFIKIDCLEINEELVKISPFLKTIITPQEIYTKIVPKIFNCFDTYWTLKRLVAKYGYKPKNKKEIKELLDLKYNNEYEELENEYRIHKFVNYILIDNLIDKYKNTYYTKEIKKIIKNHKKKRFFDKSLIKYALYKQNFRYNLLSRFSLSAFLHNIYYDYLSKRYKKARFNDASRLFKLNFFINDARKSVLSLKEQYDYIFLDAFTFSKAPELWTVEFMAELYKRLAPTGLIMTYSNSALVRNTFLENNFYVGKIYNEKAGKFIGTIAAKDKSLIKYPLSSYETGLCNTKAGIPYHDPNLNLTKEEILKRREREFKTSELMSSSAYMKSRMIRREDE